MPKGVLTEADAEVSAFLFCRRCKDISKENLINEEIRDKELRVIDSDGTQLGVMSLEDAMALANERKLDLVNISPTAKPPVCKILDYGKYRYELQKREKEAKKKQKTTQVKEIRLSTFIEDHDIMVKANTAPKFLKDGDKVITEGLNGLKQDAAIKPVPAGSASPATGAKAASAKKDG